jgi:TfoX/Sxy family transcriptional regulator of competence genes
MPRASEAAMQAFRSLVPSEPDVNSRAMFGQLVAFVNGNMFMGLFGDRLFVRLSDEDRAVVLAQGGDDFTTRGYVMLPGGWADRPEEAKRWVAIALREGRSLPPKPARARS